MTRKGEVTPARLQRQWPHHVALPVGKVRGLSNRETVRGLCGYTVGGAADVLPAPWR